MQHQRGTLTGGAPGTGANEEWANVRQPESFAVLHGIISTDIGNRTRVRGSSAGQRRKKKRQRRESSNNS